MKTRKRTITKVRTSMSMHLHNLFEAGPVVTTKPEMKTAIVRFQERVNAEVARLTAQGRKPDVETVCARLGNAEGLERRFQAHPYQSLGLVSFLTGEALS